MNFNDDFQSMTLVEITKFFIEYGEGLTRNKRSCKGCSDDELFLINFIRVINANSSGRDFLQKIHDGVIDGLPRVKRASYFDAIKSKRRLAYVKDVSDGIYKLMERIIREKDEIDYLADIPELLNRQVFAADGHSITHAVHDNKIKEKYPCMTEIYSMNLRTGLLTPMAILADENSSKPNEIRYLKKEISKHAKKYGGTRPLYIYDRAIIDFKFLTITTREDSILIITRAKISMKPIIKEPLEYDELDPINEGITGYYLIGLNNAGTLYQVDYIDPETKQEYSFITNDSSLRPGTVAYLYRIRWKIEKTFDVLKNKLFEKKAWGTSATAKEMQANIIASSYNLMLFFEHIIKKDIDGKLKTEKKREESLKAREKVVKIKNLEKEKKEKPKNFKSRKELILNREFKIPNHEFLLPHIYQITQQFIRGVRNWLARKVALKQMLPILKERLKCYI